MPILPDALLDDPFLNDAFDFSRYPTFKTRNAKLLTQRNELRHRTRKRTALFTSSRGSPSRVQRSRNVSEPQLISSTNYMRESWFTGFASARTVADIANLSSNDEIFPIIHSQTTTDTCKTLGDRSCCDVDADQSPNTLLAACEDSCETAGPVESSEYKGEDESFYSVDSADQDAHPFLLSMPIIPQIKLERKATVRKPDPAPLLEAAQHQSFLSPRIRDLRTPARMSSRRYGRILARTDAIQDRSHVHGTLSFEASQGPGTELACTRSVSEPLLNSAYPPGDEETLESPHSDVLLSMIDEVGSSPGPHNECQESGIDDPARQKQVLARHFKRSHQRSSVNHSISLSSIVHAVAEGCASLDLLLRKPKAKPKATTKPKPKPHERTPNPHDPTSKWAPKQGRIIIKVFVPSTDDIWMFRVPQDSSLTDFTSRVVGKLGFSVSFSGSVWDEPQYYFRTNDRFKSWVKGRIRFGRNLPIVAHVPPRLPLVRLGVDGVGCEVWCYA
ncbi:hypothetical protein JVT61DRAFT_3598 [Boletus reticuloceps]|uniref:Uncharacterized protein n=1 Tax=Boletus reticuloceps TaxID=495285 RepID=A0A8I2YLS0_9AGAM|nr:hypothetical protein JVT61DRAFT_3598 [Boletus reticuloceps]